MYQHLRHGKRRRKRGNRKDSRGIILDRVPIDKRPKIVEKRVRAGDIEVDFMMSKNHRGAILVMTYRAILHAKLHILKNRKSEVVSKAMINCLQQIQYAIYTITFDI
jgi:IS30 family transposase